MKFSQSYNHYYLHDEITEILKSYEEKYPDYAKLVSLNKTQEGRDIWLLKLTNTASGGFDEKPGYCANGPVHAQEVVGTMSIMFFLDFLLTNREEEEVAQLLNDYTIYAIPNPTPDGTECYLTTPEILRSVDRMYPEQELQPGLQMKDMDGDGVIRQMRFKDPQGPWKISEEDPRMMIPRKPDEIKGEFYQVFREGYFEGEGDWREHAHNAPEKWGHDLNRSWPIGWRPEALQKGEGNYPLQNVENRTLAEFFSSQKNLCAVLIFHCSAGVFFYPPSYKKPGEAPKEDMDRYKAVLAMGTEETGYPVENVYETFCQRQGMFSAGSMDDYLHFGLGLFSCACECWDLETQAGIPGKWDRLPAKETGMDKYNYEYKTLKWVDEHIGKEAFKPWTKFDHPQLGEVEIGGFDYKFVIVNCPIPFLQQEIEKTSRFMFRQVMTLPKLELSGVKVTGEGDGIYRIEANVLNQRFLPTYVTREAVNLKLVKPVTAELSGNVQIVSGAAKQDLGQLQGMSGVRCEHHFTNYVMIPSDPIQKKAVWVVKGRPGTEVKIKAASQRAGNAEITVVLE